MVKAKNSDHVINKTLAQDELSCFEWVEKYEPYMQNSMGSVSAAEDLKHEVLVKMLERDQREPNWWNNVDNKKSYTFTTIRNTAFNLKKKLPQIPVISLDDEENKLLFDSLSDLGKWVRDLNTEMDLEKNRLTLKSIMENFTEQEQLILQLNFIEGLKPQKVAEVLKSEYKINFDNAMISMECNKVRNKFRNQLKRKLKDEN